MDQAQIGRANRQRTWVAHQFDPTARARSVAESRQRRHRRKSGTTPTTRPCRLWSMRSRCCRSGPDWKMTPRDMHLRRRQGHRRSCRFCFSSASIVVLFFIACRLFDQRLALLSCALVLICDMIWQYSLSGLPQMLMLFLFSADRFMCWCERCRRNTAAAAVGIWLGRGRCRFRTARAHATRSRSGFFVGALVFTRFLFPTARLGGDHHARAVRRALYAVADPKLHGLRPSRQASPFTRCSTAFGL